MRHILSFEKFVLNEEETNTTDEKKDINHPERLTAVVEKDFFNELKTHINYWFNYETLKDKFILSSVECDENEATCWFCDRTEDNNPKYSYKLYFSTNEELHDIDKIDKVMLSITIYDYNEQTKLKGTEMEITLKHINDDFMSKMIEKVSKRIQEAPESEEDINKFKKRETRRLSDDIY